MLDTREVYGGIAIYRANHNDGYGFRYYVVASFPDGKEWNGSDIEITIN
ncbi:hypothetical protein [Faecalimicrobium sp. JNUCC 81]